ncbi:MAG: acetate/propionate family kinase [Syntrophales bacterium]|nr:acetate/propionate family kinase [Syntrophales bacterium]
MDTEKFIQSIYVFSDLKPDDINTLINSTQSLHFPKGSRIIKFGEMNRFLWILTSGEAEVMVPTEDGSEESIATLKSGDIFGEMSILTGEPTIASIITKSDVSVLKVPRETISQIITKNPSMLMKLTGLISKRYIENARLETERQLRKAAHSESQDPYDLNFTSCSEPMKILVINCGSSSLKFTLFDTLIGAAVIEGLVERIGTGDVHFHLKTPDKKWEEKKFSINNMEDAFRAMLGTLTDPALKILKDIKEINAVGHRVVHGGKRFSNSVVIDNEVQEAIRSFIPLAPLHNPYNLKGIEIMTSLLTDVPQVAVFDTAFHLNMPAHASIYALPAQLCEENDIRRYGFHGTNHRFVALSAATFLKKRVGELKIISCHLGNGASVCAIDHGRSVDTSMGMTPLEGLIMGTRSGDLDPGILLQLMRHKGLNYEELDRILNRESGLKGITELSSDMREILAAAEEGNMACKLAVSAFCYRVKKYIGAYAAALGGLDVLIFTGGIGENSPEIRARICQGLDVLGINILEEENRKTSALRGKIATISPHENRVKVLVIPADEERMIARETIHALGRALPVEDLKRFRTTPIPLSTSAHHVHLSKEDFESLFGEGRKLTPKAELSQPGQFAAEETVNLIGPKGRIDKVRILGPFRKETQVEISRTEEFKLGVDAPIRESGDLEGTPGIVIEGERGTIRINKGVICARRHIHLSPEEALKLGLRDKDVVMVRVKGERELIFGDVLVRVHPEYRMDMHIDTDEANAAEISEGAVGFIESIQHRNYM